MSKKELKPIFKEPFGELGDSKFNREIIFHDFQIKCELCGRIHNEGVENGVEDGNNDESFSTFSFLGRKGLHQCCGGVIDVLFKEFGELFTQAFLIKFADDPTNDRFSKFIPFLEIIFKNAKNKIKETGEGIGEAEGEFVKMAKLLGQ